MLFSVRMRAAQGGPHEAGGKHISGAECLTRQESIKEVCASMVERALSHTKGEADFINITVEAVEVSAVREIRVLPISSFRVSSVETGRAAAVDKLVEAGVTSWAAERGLELLTRLPESMRGAMLICAHTGIRLDNTGSRGVRVSRMDAADASEYQEWLWSQGYGNIHIQEALLLASKVNSTPGIIAELCWSDDPEYIAGYVAAKGQYVRFSQLKPLGSEVGGRIFFVTPDTNMEEVINYLQYQPVIVNVPGGYAK